MSRSKACSKCGEEKPLDAYYKHPMMIDGRLSKCIECTKASVRANRSAKIEYYRAYDRMRAQEPHRVAARIAAARSDHRPRPEMDPQKKLARTALGNAIRDGKLAKAPECEVCARSDEALHGHHEDYSKPLEVIWVCTGCHALIHAYWRAQDRMAG